MTGRRILNFLQFVSSVAANAGSLGGIPFLTHIIIIEIRVGQKHLIAFSFALLLIVLTGSHTSNCFSLALGGVYTNMQKKKKCTCVKYMCILV